MSRIGTLVAAAAAIALTATVASAQTGGLTNGPNGMQPNTPGSESPSSGINANKPSRAVTNPNSGYYKDTGANLIRRRPAHSRHRHQKH